ncbi:mechanosensitive ion channel family protein [Aliiglaciecola litoralis]|uniref:Small-conductance mechanosensitive channel n=1 Tax=Aliiglaciecola litoralis TaxID=582857 RepID=A0ABN1LI63_9ALTE
MPSQEDLLNFVILSLPLALTIIVVVVTLWLAHVFLIKRHAALGNEKLFSRQLTMLGLSIVGVLVIILALPISDSSRNQIIGLVGLVLSGIFAFSSSTIFANLLAGIMMRITTPFKTGDFIQVDTYFGRVVERGLLDTEIQTEASDLVALPNTFMITHPISVTRSTGTIISTSLSLGYDIHHSTITSLLTQAAENCGLTDPFVHIVELGDFSITYKISGKLEEVKSLISSRTMLNREVLDVLHDSQIEIMSPSFMNQRRLPDELKMIPPKQTAKQQDDAPAVEEVIFDKAEAAEQKEQKVESVKAQITSLKEQLSSADAEQKTNISNKIATLTEKLKNSAD